MSRTRGAMRWTRRLRRRTQLIADGKVVWFWRPDAGAKCAGSIPRATVAKEPGHREEHEVSRKPCALFCKKAGEADASLGRTVPSRRRTMLTHAQERSFRAGSQDKHLPSLHRGAADLLQLRRFDFFSTTFRHRSMPFSDSLISSICALRDLFFLCRFCERVFFCALVSSSKSIKSTVNPHIDFLPVPDFINRLSGVQ